MPGLVFPLAARLLRVAAETAEETVSFTQRDREMLAEIHAMLGELRPYLPLIERAARLLDNPAARWRRKHGGAGAGDTPGE